MEYDTPLGITHLLGRQSGPQGERFGRPRTLTVHDYGSFCDLSILTIAAHGIVLVPCSTLRSRRSTSVVPGPGICNQVAHLLPREISHGQESVLAMTYPPTIPSETAVHMQCLIQPRDSLAAILCPEFGSALLSPSLLGLPSTYDDEGSRMPKGGTSTTHAVESAAESQS